MKKLVVKLDLYDDKAKQRAMKIVSGLSGVESIQIELKDKKLTVVGDVDPVSVVSKLRKVFTAEIVSLGPAKKKEEEAAEKAEEKTAAQKDPVAELLKAYEAYNPYVAQHYNYVFRSVEENPNACVLC